MKYVPKKMIKKSRFKDFYLTLDNDVRKNVSSNIDKLINENPSYTDKKNFSYLCNLFTSLALEQVFEDIGKSRKESIEIVKNAMYKYIEPQVEEMKKLSKSKYFIPFLKVTMPIKFKLTLGYGWQLEFPKASADEFKMTTHKCIFSEIFSKYNIPEMTAIFCHVDDILYKNLPGADFIYTEQIGTGGKVCDYTFKRK